MESNLLKQLETVAFAVRKHIIRMSCNGGCFIGASLSCTDLLVYLYFGFLKLEKGSLNDPLRDYVLLSKGHDVPALYGCFVELGWLDRKRLFNHLKTNDSIYWHPNTNIPGVEFHSGSLGQLPSVAMGIAMDCKLKKQNNRVFVVMGDGELNEGSIWETMLVAANMKLSNLCFIVDRNYFQANKATEELMPLEPLEDKFRAFGLLVKRINGHDFNELEQAFEGLPYDKERPSVIICDTVRGKGLPSIEERADRWFVNFTEEEVAELEFELAGNYQATIYSDALIVR